jgi:hypothetical protein
MHTLIFPVLFFALSMMTACGSEKSDINAKQHHDAHIAAPQSLVDTTPILDVQRAELGYKPSPGLKIALRAELVAIQRWRTGAKQDEPIPKLITELNSLFKALTITARALDRDSSFASDIRVEMKKFDAVDKVQTGDASRIMNGMTGVYAMYALLAKMKFMGQAEKQAAIQKIHDSTVKTFAPEIPAVEAAASIADACYKLTEMIMEEIDSENRFDEAFRQIERQYSHGVNVAKKEEDHFINGMFRTFEISQLWALSLNSARSEDISLINANISDESSEAENVETQMGIAVKYLFMISYVIAQDTVELTL